MKELTFEEANSKLHSAIEKIEKNDVSLDEAMKLYQEAFTYLTYCYKELNSAKGKIEDINEKISKCLESGEVYE